MEINKTRVKEGLKKITGNHYGRDTDDITYVVNALNSWRKHGTERVDFTKTSPNLDQLTEEQMFFLEEIGASYYWDRKKYRFGTESLPWSHHIPAIVVILVMIAAFTVGGLIHGNKIGEKKRMEMPYVCASSASTVNRMRKNCCSYNYGWNTSNKEHKERWTAGNHCRNVWFASGSFLLISILIYIFNDRSIRSYSKSFLRPTFDIGALLFICAVFMTIPVTEKRDAYRANYIENQNDESDCDISIMKDQCQKKWCRCHKSFCAHLYEQNEAGEWVKKD